MAEFDVEVTTESDVSLPSEFDVGAVTSLVEHVLRHEEAHGEWSLAVRFVSDPVMQQMHLDFMGLDSPTDIMTFPYEKADWPVSEAEGPASAESGGDLVISVDRAAANAAEAGWTTADELFFLVSHGLLHLLGWDDARAAERQRMLDRQHALLESWRNA